jgi:hypothetical protein
VTQNPPVRTPDAEVPKRFSLDLSLFLSGVVVHWDPAALCLRLPHNLFFGQHKRVVLLVKGSHEKTRHTLLWFLEEKNGQQDDDDDEQEVIEAPCHYGSDDDVSCDFGTWSRGFSKYSSVQYSTVQYHPTRLVLDYWWLCLLRLLCVVCSASHVSERANERTNEQTSTDGLLPCFCLLCVVAS